MKIAQAENGDIIISEFEGDYGGCARDFAKEFILRFFNIIDFEKLEGKTEIGRVIWLLLKADYEGETDGTRGPLCMSVASRALTKETEKWRSAYFKK
ncbi:hypothetical protein [Cloacibacillus porcorum]|uniref:hypothetical protein n=1 Tax=Cloacibacillus porcorum TaxID=1197717 RepID=UPI003F0E868B